MVLEQTSGGWTATEVDPAVTSDVSLIESASQIRLGQPEPRPANVLFQALMVLAAALAAGLLVFFVVRAAVSSDANTDEQAQDFSELPTVGLDLENQDGDASSGVGSSRSGSKRDTLEDGIPEEETPPATPTAAAEDQAASADAEPAAEVDTDAAATDQPDTENVGNPLSEANGGTDNGISTDPQPGSDTADPATSPSTTAPQSPATSDPGQPGTPTTAGPAPTTATTAAPTTQTTSAPSTTVTTIVSTTTATTPSTATTPTTAGSTTTTSIATGTTLAAPSLISAPIEGSVHTWETGILFAARDTPDAVRYCWKLESADKNVQECSADTDYALPGGKAGVNPGIVVVSAQAQDADGAVLNSETMTLKVIARNIIDAPAAGENYDRGDDLRVDFEEIPTATEYCVTLVQDSLTLPTVCDNDDRVTIRLRRFSDGPVTVQAEVMRSAQIIGRQTIEIDYNR